MTGTPKAVAALASAVLLTSPLLAAPRAPSGGIVSYEATCPSDTQQQSLFASLLTVIAKPAIELGIKALGGALSQAGADKDYSLTAHAPINFYELAKPDGTQSAYEVKLAGECVVMAFGPEGGDTGPQTLNVLAQGPRLWLQQHNFERPPAVYVEAKILSSNDRTAFQLVPVVAWIGKSMGPRGFASSKRDIALAISLISPGGLDDSNVTATRSILFSNVTSSKLIGHALSSKGTSWIPMPALSEALTERLTAANTRLEELRGIEKQISDLKAKPKLTKEEKATLAAAEASLTRLTKLVESDSKSLKVLLPLTLRVDMHETRDGNAFLAKLGDLLTEKAGDIAQPLADRLDPEKRQTAAIEAGTAADNLRKAVIEKVAAWQTTVADPASTTAQKRIALIDARAACRELEIKGFAEADCHLLPAQ